MAAKVLATSLFDDGMLFHFDQLGLIFFLSLSKAPALGWRDEYSPEFFGILGGICCNCEETFHELKNTTMSTFGVFGNSIHDSLKNWTFLQKDHPKWCRIWSLKDPRVDGSFKGLPFLHAKIHWDPGCPRTDWTYQPIWSFVGSWTSLFVRFCCVLASVSKLFSMRFVCQDLICENSLFKAVFVFPLGDWTRIFGWLSTSWLLMVSWLHAREGS